MIDYRTPENRAVLFEKLYTLNLEYGVMPGCVYLYFPALKAHLGWDDETALWFAFLNGMTQNPLTSLRLFEQLPAPPDVVEISKFNVWFDDNWASLQFDTDRRYGKKETCKAIVSYTRAMADYENSQTKMFAAQKDYHMLWCHVENRFHSFGRLTTFSYLEYLRIFGHGKDCTDMMFHDRGGSKSHRNGMLFLQGLDHLVDDKRAKNDFDGNYGGPVQFMKMCGWLEEKASEWMSNYKTITQNRHPHAGFFTMESNLCQFKNGFFGRRYPGVYADMGWERLKWYKKNIGEDKNYKLIMEIREALPDWLRMEKNADRFTLPERAAIFPRTGVPYRAEHFL
jgi:hypothetical protein